MQETAQSIIQLFVQLMTILESCEAAATIQHATLVVLQDTLAERDTGQQAVEAERIVIYSQNESLYHFESNVFYVWQ
jgi:hypothetical protein